ncbi:hypothetical protein CYMTET_54340 [Cymbomonas tetramitiformis]|uniref:EF-hand domain-containing protein n=1 Tax=Cymbomonas tetramitiformis TaxID=36881 RepID=A0AAE0EPN8_9CHLO|nr:hypothetical protein CYMTET_54340 [Cymbomonas tetramitiformis]|eukprot:gene2981-3798_t
MAAAIYVAKKKRDAAKQKKREEQKKIDEVFRQFDETRSGSLNRAELAEFLKFLNEETPVSDDEVSLVLHIADSHDGVLDGGVSRKEFLVAADAWSAYQSNKGYIQEVMSKYDKSQTGTLSREELKEFLQDLNDGEPPSDSDLEQVLRFADGKDGVIDGVIKPTEIVFAVSIWYSMLDEEGSLFGKICNNYTPSGQGCVIV